MAPKVSVIVPIYNVEKYLKQCLDSLRNQTLKDIEIICVDDGSTDSSGKICDEYAENDARIKVVHKPNAGYGNSINTGIAHAQGKYVGILESDDFADKKMYENLWNLAEEFQADNVRSSWFEYYTDTDMAINVGTIPPKYANKVITFRDYHKILKNKTMIWAGIFKKDFLESNNIRCLETPGASFQDTSFNFKTLTLAKRLVLTEKPYIYYRKDNINSSVKSSAKVYYICDEYEEITKFLDEHPDIKEVINYRKLINEYNNYVWDLLRISEEYRTELTNKFIEIFGKYFEDGELDEKFFKKISKKELDILLHDKEKFFALIKKKSIKKQNRDKRRMKFSLKICPARISLVMFGKQIIHIEF